MANFNEENLHNSQDNRSLDLCKRVVTTESFIAEAKEIYGDRYDYSKVDYKNREHRVIVTCPIHGDFQVYAREHLDGKGCPKCEKGDKFIVKLRGKFGDKFGLDEFIYESSTSPVTLICPTHGAFSKLPHGILNSRFGCPECGNEVQRQQQEESHKAAVAKKEEIRKAKEEQDTQRLKDWEEERAAQRNERERAMKAFLAGKKVRGFHSPFQVYQQLVDEHIDDIRYNAKWREPYRVPFRLSDKEARTLKCYSEGYVFYKYVGEAPTVFIRQAFERDYSFGRGLEDTLSHRGCVVSFDGNDLIIQVENYEKENSRFEYHTSTNKPAPQKLSADFVSIDFETLYPQRVSACSIGMVKYRNGKKVDQYYSLIRPPFDYPGKKGQTLTWVHGISEDDLRNEKTFVELLPEIENFVGGLPLVAHNASVEKSCICDMCAYYEVKTQLNYNNIIDTLPLSKEVETKVGIKVEGKETHSLDAVCSRFCVPVLNHHNALEDAEMCGNLMVKLREILVEGKAFETTYNNADNTKIINEKKQNTPSVNLEVQTQPVEGQNSKNGCLSIIVIGVTLLSLVAFL